MPGVGFALEGGKTSVLGEDELYNRAAIILFCNIVRMR